MQLTDSFNYDQPIRNEEQDKLERNSFANFITDIIISPINSPSKIVGLEDTWGMGKTSVLNLVHNNLKELQTPPIIVNFNPWLVGSLDSVIEAFFLELASSIGSSKKSIEVAEKATKEILNFSKYLSPIRLIPGTGPWYSVIKSFLGALNKVTKKFNGDDLSLFKKKEKTKKSIRELKLPIVVIIDDIDRLPPNEICIVFQVIKAIGDFDNVSYLLAYDPKPVIQALSYNNNYDGSQFLKKIVQVSYRLPRISFSHKKDFLLSSVNSLLKDNNVELENTQRVIFQNAITSTGIIKAFNTPRDIIRVKNNLISIVKNLWDEVCFTDALLFETLDLQLPEIAKDIRENPQKFMDTITFDEENINQSRSNEINELISEESTDKIIKKLIQEFPLYDGSIIKSIVEFLFPQLKTDSLYLEEEHRINNRFCTKEVFTRYFHSGKTQFTYSANDAHLFVTSKDDRNNIVDDLISADLLNGWFEYVRPYIETIEIDDPKHLCSFLLELSSDNRFLNTNLDGPIANTLHTIIHAIRDDNLRKELTVSICSNKEVLNVSEYFITELLSEHGLWNRGVYSDKIDKQNNSDTYSDLFQFKTLISLKDSWLKTVREISKTTDLIEKYADPLGILFRWGQLANDYGEVKKYIGGLISKSGVQHFLKVFPKGKSFNGIEELISDMSVFIIEIEKLGKAYPRQRELLKYLSKHNK